MPPPDKLKKLREQHIKQQEVEEIQESKEPFLNHLPAETASATLMNVIVKGLPAVPLLDYAFPSEESKKGNQRERINHLCKSILRPEFIDSLKKTNFFDIRSHRNIGEVGEHLHLGESYCTNGQSTAGHAWLIIVGDGVWQFHFVHPGCQVEPIPNFLLSIENYLMYIHLRIGHQLPSNILK